MTTRGTYIAFEGLEGCGKSTHVTRLAEKVNAVATREPGGTRIGALLRSILADPENTDLNSRTELLLMTADRAQHMSELIEPALQRGQHVVSDRSVYSTLAYQGYGRGLDVDTLLSINTWALNNVLPDIVVWIQIPTEEANTRLAKRNLDRFEREGADFFARIGAGFAELAAKDPARWILIDGLEPKDVVEEKIFAAVAAHPSFTLHS
ncbi:MAG: dTMP kinase [Ilumatobacteraceae bacterium]|nr:dTMP kinase [Ilumatobacteraceae bacterium]